VVARRALQVAQGAAVGLVVLLLALLVWKLVDHNGGALAASAAKGEHPKAPDFTLERLNGSGSLQLSRLRGKAVAVNFWASWCAPCKEEAPVLEQTWNDFRRRGLVVVGVDAQDLRPDARTFARRYGLTYPIVYDGPGASLGRYGVTGFPETYVIDRRGRVVQAFVGSVSSAEQQAGLKEAVEEALRP
jgi:cytochrome c biogenesis protein CcmG/thiol:disulfide interchange protein DsbE